MAAPTTLQHLPFSSVWKMRIDHPYSLFVREGPYFWSCGQCPLNEAGEVLAPGDLFAQTTLLTGFIDTFLGKIDVDRKDLTVLVVYYVSSADGEGERLMEVLNAWCGQQVIVVPVSVPHFYYEGMMVEVDVYGATGTKSTGPTVGEGTGLALQRVGTGQLDWYCLRVPDEAQLEDAVNGLLGEGQGLADCIISDQWFVSSDAVARRLQARTGGRLSTGCEVVGIQRSGFAALGLFAIGKKRVFRDTFSSSEPGIENVKVSISRNGDFFEVMAACTEAVGLVEETRRIMQAIDWTLSKHSLSFQDVRKSTTYYIAGSSADELHDNMSVRNAYYTKPGPGSTGLPVQSFPLTTACVSVRIFGTVPTDQRSERECRRKSASTVTNSLMYK